MMDWKKRYGQKEEKPLSSEIDFTESFHVPVPQAPTGMDAHMPQKGKPAPLPPGLAETHAPTSHDDSVPPNLPV
jgi:hypothetical protein